MRELAPKRENLSVRERQIAEAYAAGRSYREIAERLFIASTTVRTHLGTIYRKLGVSTKIELLRTLEIADRPCADPGSEEFVPSAQTAREPRADPSVTELLQVLGLHQYADSLAANAVDMDILMTLTDNDLRELGVQAIGHRRRLLDAIHERRSSNDRGGRVEGTQSERRHLTIVFVVLAGSMELSTQLDPEQMQELLGDYQKAVAKEAARFQGHIANVMGDGIANVMGDGMLVSFGWPNAHEDDAERAVRASLAIRASIGGLRATGDSSLAVQIGIASGIVVVGEGIGHAVTLAGDTPNLASRLRALAKQGQIVIAESTRRLLGDVFELADLGRQSVKGIVEPVQTFAVTREKPVESRFDARSGSALLPMVGRDQELALLLERWSLAKAGEGQGVLLVGEAGIGKSRIARALADSVADEPHTRIRYQCSPYHAQSALWPVIQHLTYAAGIDATDQADAKLDKLEALLDRTGDPGDTTALLADLVGLDGAPRYGTLDLPAQVRRARILAALVGQLLGLAARQPVLVVMEDAHWIDPTTLELIEQCLDRIAAAPVLILLTSRPDQQPELASHPHVTRLTLNRLGRAGIKTIVARLGGDHLPAEVIDTIIARTDGVPLFVEELTKGVLEAGETAVPASLHDSLMARLDRVPEVKEIAQIAACIGREFDYPMLAAIVDRTECSLQSALNRLTAAELVFRRGMPPDASYTFKHALVQDTAYASLLRRRRRELHARIARTLEEQFPEVLRALPEVVAHQYTEAGCTVRAVELWERAGEREARRWAHLEAIGHFRKALSLVDALPAGAERSRRQLELLLALGPALIAAEGMASDRVIETYRRARELGADTGDPEQAYTSTWGLWLSTQQRGLLGEAQRLAREVLTLAEKSCRSDLLLQAHHAAWTTLFFQDDLPACLKHTEQGRTLYDMEAHRAHALRYGGHDPGVCACANSGLVLWLMGFPDQAVEHAREALELAERLDHPVSLSVALFFASILHQYRREPGPARSHLDALLVLSREKHIPHYEGSRAIIQGWVDTAEGHGEAGVAEVLRGLKLHLTSLVGLRRPYYYGILADTLAQCGDLQGALAAIDQGSRAEERHWGPELHRLRGELLRRERAAGDAAASDCLGQALTAARRQGARSLELRAATSLGRLWAEQGERQKAHDLLAPIYAWFTEGFDTPDLKDAKALLDALR